MTLNELRGEIAALNARGMGGSSHERHYAFAYHGRLALAVTPILFRWLALGVAQAKRVGRSTTAAGVAVAVICFAFWCLLQLSRLGTLAYGWPLALIWLPNVSVGMGAFVLRTTVGDGSLTVRPNDQ